MREALFKITEKCPCNCLFCKSEDFGFSKKVNSEITLNDWKGIIDELICKGLEVVVISGGEPLISIKTTLGVVKYLKSKNIFTVLNTSGVLFNNSYYLNQLILNYPDLLVFSIDSSNPNQHDKNRNIVGLYDTIVKTIIDIKKLGDYSIAIRVVITKYNYFQIPEIIKTFNSLNVDCIKFTNIENDTKGFFRLTISDLMLFNDQIRSQIVQSLNECHFESNILKVDSISKFKNIFNPKTIDFKLFSRGIFSPQFKENEKCSLIERYCVIQSNGDVLPCCESEHHNFPIYGNFKINNSEQIFTSESFLKTKKTRASYCTNCTQPHNIQINFTDKALTVNKR